VNNFHNTVLFLVIHFNLLDDFGGVEGDAVEVGEDPFGGCVFPVCGSPEAKRDIEINQDVRRHQDLLSLQPPG
jgi:hypothetical protein